jgi:hypothetical protein
MKSPKIIVLGKLYYDYPLTEFEIDSKTKMIGNHRLSSYSLFADTPENRLLLKEHNKAIEDLEKATDAIRLIISKMKKHDYKEGYHER